MRFGALLRLFKYKYQIQKHRRNRQASNTENETWNIRHFRAVNPYSTISLPHQNGRDKRCNQAKQQKPNLTHVSSFVIVAI